MDPNHHPFDVCPSAYSARMAALLEDGDDRGVVDLLRSMMLNAETVDQVPASGAGVLEVRVATPDWRARGWAAMVMARLRSRPGAIRIRLEGSG